MVFVKPVGIYRDMYQTHRESLPLLSESYTGRVISDRSKIAEYMNAGIPVFDIMEDVVDLIDGREWIRGGPSLLTDGEWLWRRDSIYYLRNYPLDIPDQFLDHVRRRNYQPSTEVDVADESFDEAIAAYF
jgi:hypothetical protein